jgi:uncharacterized lipoprotein YajG
MLRNEWSRKATKLGLMLSATLLLAGCQTTSSTATLAAKCAGLKPITYSTKGDSAATRKQVRLHNATGRKLGCW